jgi:hypothetical protein
VLRRMNPEAVDSLQRHSGLPVRAGMPAGLGVTPVAEHSGARR